MADLLSRCGMTTFDDLPEEIRDRIYVLAGIRWAVRTYDGVMLTKVERFTASKSR